MSSGAGISATNHQRLQGIPDGRFAASLESLGHHDPHSTDRYSRSASPWVFAGMAL
jgi:hypothetical protein